jgi:hypothetical protein
MADEAGEVIAEVQADAAHVVASEVAQVVAITDGMIAAEVGHVGEQLAEHAAETEVQHEEILEGQEQWQNVAQQLGGQLSSLQANLLAFQTTQQATNQAMLAELQTLNQRLSTVSQPLNQTPPAEAVIAVVEPESGAVDLPAVEAPPARKRRVI